MKLKRCKNENFRCFKNLFDRLEESSYPWDCRGDSSLLFAFCSGSLVLEGYSIDNCHCF